ncbi:aldo/keto reductase [Paenibacillus sp. PAMC21692]|uniref:aldo/keto reductase n=1 Tax=Paenibacillus sp. PAMC21692 TaxID=2762320 RepID=UPI00164D8443|nr:aldo/keto reductase [Paenibacillus sp. PAMC21692]QNK59512.1 aldo/keto reductase [Paenibacillus sp. PAMC21692]
MIKQTIYKTDLHASVICLGAAFLGNTINEKESFRLMDAYVDLGGNGKWLKLSKRHERIIVGTKGACPTTEHFFRLSRMDILADLHNSLKNLQTDCLDLYWLHRDDPARPVEEVIDLLNEQVQVGKIRYFGCSNWTLPRIQAAQTYAEQHNKQGFCANQPLWSLANPISNISRIKPSCIWMTR